MAIITTSKQTRVIREMIEFMKKYQVAEHKDGKWSVVSFNRQQVMGAEVWATVNMSTHGFNSAAEAQELADELNKEA